MNETHTEVSFSAKEKRLPPVKPHNKDVRPREHLLKEEVNTLLRHAGDGRYGDRNYCLVLMMYRHALRVSEAADLVWDNVNLKDRKILIVRQKDGDTTAHYLERDEVIALTKLAKKPADRVGFVFKSARGECLSVNGIYRIVSDLGRAAGINFQGGGSVHPHMLRHAKGYQLAAAGTDTRAIQGYMGHRSINSTVIYTQLAPDRFKNFGKGDL